MRILLVAAHERLLPQALRRLERRWGPSADIVAYTPSGAEHGGALLELAQAGEPELGERWRALRRRLDALVAEHLQPLFACADTNVWEGACDLWHQFHLRPLFRHAFAVRRAIELREPERVAVAVGWPGRSWWRGDEGDLAAACGDAAERAGIPCDGLPSATWEGLRGAAWRWTAAARGARDALKALRWAAQRASPPPEAPGQAVMFVGLASPQTDVSRALAETLPGGADQAVLFAPTGRAEGQPWPHMRSPGMYWTWGRALRALWWSVLPRARSVPGRELEAICEEFGLPVAPVLRRLWRVRADALALALEVAWIAGPMLEEVKPRALVVSHGRMPELAALLRAARDRGITTGYHMHGVWDARVPERVASLPVDFALVFGPYYSDAFAAEGMAPEQVQIVGRWEARSGREEGGGLGSPPHAPLGPPHALCAGAEHVIVCLSQPGVGEGQGPGGTWAGVVLAAAAQIPGARVLLKLHPRESDAGRVRYRAAVECTGTDAVLVEHSAATMPDLLPLADAVVTQFSTAGFDALAAGVPLVAVNLRPEQDFYPFVAEGAALGVHREDEMLPQLERALFDEGARERLREAGSAFLRRHMGPADPVPPDWRRMIRGLSEGEE